MSEKEMEIPLENKEILPSAETMLVSKRKYQLSIMGNVITLFTTFFALLIAFVPVAQIWVTNDDKLLEQKAEYQMKVQTKIDSFNSVINLKSQKENAENRNKIYELINELRNQLPKSAQIVVYYTHDSGGIPYTGSPLNVTSLYSANNLEPYLGRTYWQNQVVPQGYIKFNSRVINNRFIYIPNVETDPDLLSDLETMEDLRSNNTKALMGVYLKENAYAVYYMAVSWNIENPYYENFRSRIIIKKYAAAISELIQPKLNL